MSLAQNDWTVERLRELPDDGNRYEVIDGVLLVSPSPSAVHQRAVGKLHLLLAPHADQVGMEVFVAPSARTWSPRTEVQPDLVAVPLEDGRLVERFEDVKELALAVEVLSPVDDAYGSMDQTSRVSAAWCGGVLDCGHSIAECRAVATGR